MTTSVYVGNLASTTTEDALRNAFTGAGISVKNVLIMRSPQTDRSRGFGFVELDSQDQAEAAIHSMKEAKIDGRPLKLGLARERAAPADGRSFQSYSGLGGSPRPRRPGGGQKRKPR